jgi:hypothetical protein
MHESRGAYPTLNVEVGCHRGGLVIELCWSWWGCRHHPFAYIHPSDRGPLIVEGYGTLEDLLIERGLRWR